MTAQTQLFDLFSRAMESLGRVLIEVSFEPIVFSIGVFALFLPDRLQAIALDPLTLRLPSVYS